MFIAAKSNNTGFRRNSSMGQVNINPGDGGGNAAAIVLVVVVLLVLVLLVLWLTGVFGGGTSTTSEIFQILGV
jgi:hypothetical protein